MGQAGSSPEATGPRFIAVPGPLPPGEPKPWPTYDYIIVGGGLSYDMFMLRQEAYGASSRYRRLCARCKVVRGPKDESLAHRSRQRVRMS